MGAFLTGKPVLLNWGLLGSFQSGSTERIPDKALFSVSATQIFDCRRCRIVPGVSYMTDNGKSDMLGDDAAPFKKGSTRGELTLIGNLETSDPWWPKAVLAGNGRRGAGAGRRILPDWIWPWAVFPQIAAEITGGMIVFLRSMQLSPTRLRRLYEALKKTNGIPVNPASHTKFPLCAKGKRQGVGEAVETWERYYFGGFAIGFEYKAEGGSEDPGSVLGELGCYRAIVDAYACGARGRMGCTAKRPPTSTTTLRWYILTPADDECAEMRGTVEPARNSRPPIGSGNGREKNRIARKGTIATRRWISGRSQHDCRQFQGAGNGFPAIGIDNIAPQGPVPTDSEAQNLMEEMWHCKTIPTATSSGRFRDLPNWGEIPLKQLGLPSHPRIDSNTELKCIKHLQVSVIRAGNRSIIVTLALSYPFVVHSRAESGLGSNNMTTEKFQVTQHQGTTAKIATAFHLHYRYPRENYTTEEKKLEESLFDLRISLELSLTIPLHVFAALFGISQPVLV
ncbi:hypothetical protein HYFRA_00004851 [Hymenoscyphus fraxineus]|uniref:Uncharacterized protein n=1 Tax=Hymenoscyphus fraxineus TaxID=746836 RepID=A0A9N9KPG7_9HELO|nr:hypothetical protein HYFRA_00004851 [Hymenoscyphus fraxineus]